MGNQINVNQFIIATVAFLNAKNKPAPVDGVPVWLTSDSDVIALEPAADGMTCKISAVGIPRNGVTVQVTADADLGAGVEDLVVTGTIDVIPDPDAKAVTGAMTFGAPQDKP